MSNVDYDKDKYTMDSYGNLIPKEQEKEKEDEADAS